MWSTRTARVWRRRAAALGAALLLAWLALPGAPAAARARHRLPAVPPHRAAHYLADFSNHLLVFPHPESWAIESQWNNATTWHYEVSYACGAGCAGRAAVWSQRLHARGRPQHGAAGTHRVHARDQRCTRLLPPLSWPTLCEETETDILIEGSDAAGAAGAAGAGEGEGEGCWVTESAAARCGRLAALLGRCAAPRDLAARHHLRLRALQAALASSPH